MLYTNKIQQDATACRHLFTAKFHSTCFGCPLHPSSGVHKTVTAASGTGPSICATTFLQCGLVRPRWRKVVAQILWSVPEAAVTVLCTPDDGCDGFCSKKVPACCCILLVWSCDAQNHEYKISLYLSTIIILQTICNMLCMCWNVLKFRLFNQKVTCISCSPMNAACPNHPK